MITVLLPLCAFFMGVVSVFSVLKAGPFLLNMVLAVVGIGVALVTFTWVLALNGFVESWVILVCALVSAIPGVVGLVLGYIMHNTDVVSRGIAEASR